MRAFQTKLRRRPSPSCSSSSITINCSSNTSVIIIAAAVVAIMTSRSPSTTQVVAFVSNHHHRSPNFPSKARLVDNANNKPLALPKFDSLIGDDERLRRSSSSVSTTVRSSNIGSSDDGGSFDEIVPGGGAIIDAERDLFVIVDDLSSDGGEDGDDVPIELVELLPEEVMEAVMWESQKKSLAETLDVHPQQTHLHRPAIVGHRGSLYLELENTIQSFQTSHAVGCDAVELDVFLLKCGTLVVFHGGGSDENPGCLRDYMGLEGRSILDYTAAEARALAFNPHFDEFGCGPSRVMEKHDLGIAYIPTLREVLTTMRDTTDLVVKIELKGHGTPEPVLSLVEELGMVDRCHFSSFDHERIKRIRALRPEVKPDGTHRYRTGALFSDVPSNFVDMALDAGASEVHLKYDTCTKARVQSIHDAGLDSMAWFRGPIGMREDVREKYHDVGNEEEDMYRTVMASGVRAMCVNRPDVLVGMIGRRSGGEDDDGEEGRSFVVVDGIAQPVSA